LADRQLATRCPLRYISSLTKHLRFLSEANKMEKWPIGVFASVDAGLGVKLEVAHDLGVPTIQLHAPHQATRTQANADAFLKRLDSYGIRLTCVFGGFEGESYADIPTVASSVGLVPPETRAARTKELKEIADFARLLDCSAAAVFFSISAMADGGRGP